MKHKLRSPREGEVPGHSPARRTPEVHAKAEEAKQRALEEARVLRAAYRRTFSTADGVTVLRDIAKLCGARLSPVCANITTGMIDVNGTLNNAALLGLYFHITKQLTQEQISQAEENTDE